jgi:hypothetical protein
MILFNPDLPLKRSAEEAMVGRPEFVNEFPAPCLPRAQNPTSYRAGSQKPGHFPNDLLFRIRSVPAVRPEGTPAIPLKRDGGPSGHRPLIACGLYLRCLRRYL